MECDGQIFDGRNVPSEKKLKNKKNSRHDSMDQKWKKTTLKRNEKIHRDPNKVHINFYEIIYVKWGWGTNGLFLNTSNSSKAMQGGDSLSYGQSG